MTDTAKGERKSGAPPLLVLPFELALALELELEGERVRTCVVEEWPARGLAGEAAVPPPVVKRERRVVSPVVVAAAAAAALRGE